MALVHYAFLPLLLQLVRARQSPGADPLHNLSQFTGVKPDAVIGADVHHHPASAAVVFTLHVFFADGTAAINDYIHIARVFHQFCQQSDIDILAPFDRGLNHLFQLVFVKKQSVAAVAALDEKRDLFPDVDGPHVIMTDRAGTRLQGSGV